MNRHSGARTCPAGRALLIRRITTRPGAKGGWEYVNVVIDDASRLAYVEVLRDEKGPTTVGFLQRAFAQRPHGSLGARSPFGRLKAGSEQCAQTSLLLPRRASSLDRALTRWLVAQGVRPRIVAEVDDCGFLKLFGETGRVFATPSVEERGIIRPYGARVAGRAVEVGQRFHAITSERRIRKHPPFRQSPSVRARKPPDDGARAQQIG